MWATIQGISTKARKRAAQYVNHISPFKVMKTNNITYGKPMQSVGKDVFDARMAATKQTINNKGMKDSFRHWWEGGRFGMGGDAANAAWDPKGKATGNNWQAGRRRLARRATVGVLGGTLASSTLLGQDSLPTQLGTSAVSAGGVLAGTVGALELGHRAGTPRAGLVAGAGIAGYSVLNMIQRGNQTGPF